MKTPFLSFLCVSCPTLAHGWSNSFLRPSYGRSRTCLEMAAVGIFYGTSTGTTKDCAERIHKAFGSQIAAEPIDIDTVKEVGDELMKHKALVLGVPTGNVEAETERSGTGWDKLYYQKLPWLASSLEGKHVAVFGLGDQVAHPGNFADAAGELYDTFLGCGCIMFGSTEETGYMHYQSKSVREFGGYNRFCGLILDMINQEELTDERIKRWVAQLAKEGFYSPTPPPPSSETHPQESPRESQATKAYASDYKNEDQFPPSKVPDSFPVKEEEQKFPQYAAEGNGDDSDILNKAICDAEARLAELEKEQVELKEFLKDREELGTIVEESISKQVSRGFTPHVNSDSGMTMWTSEDGRKSFVTEQAPPKAATDLQP